MRDMFEFKAGLTVRASATFLFNELEEDMEQEELLNVPAAAVAVTAKVPKRSTAKQSGKTKEPKPAVAAETAALGEATTDQEPAVVAAVVVKEEEPVVKEGEPVVKEGEPVAKEKPVATESKPVPPAVSELQEEGEETKPAPPPKLFVVEEHHDTNEVIERLLDVKGVTESVSGLWGWMQGSAAKVAEAASEAKLTATAKANEVKEQATLAAAQLQEQTALKASQLKEQAATAATQLQRGLEEATAKTATTVPPSVATAVLLPWDTLPAERRNEAKDRILKLSMDDHTFTVPPPNEAAFQYDPAAREAVAHRMLDTDALLGAKRFKLVPKSVTEVEFWRNYFYRVELVLAGLGSKAAAAVEQTPVTAPVITSQADRDFEEEMRKDLAEADSSENFDMLDDDDLEFDDDEDEADLAKELQ